MIKLEYFINYSLNKKGDDDKNIIYINYSISYMSI